MINSSSSPHPILIQGGMGIGVSGWKLAKSVAQENQLGVVSLTAIETLFARRLQMGDPEGDLRRTLSAFPIPSISRQILDRYYIEGGKPAWKPFKPVPMHSVNSSRFLTDLTIAASFVEVFLAKEGHQGKIGVNLLEKIQIPTLAALYGAILAGVDYVMMGAGIPKAIPQILDQFSRGEKSTLEIFVEGSLPHEKNLITLDPQDYFQFPPELRKPFFFPIVSSHVLASHLAKKTEGTIDGFVVETPEAGGHNAPPRGTLQLNSEGEPLYSQRDQADWSIMRSLGKPFWIGGNFGSPEGLKAAHDLGARGIQVGTLFAFCNESGIKKELKQKLLEFLIDKPITLFTDPQASPTGFPFKILRLLGTVGDPRVTRPKKCDMGYLRKAYRKNDGNVGYRCPGEPIDDYLRKGGKIEETKGRVCLCNGLTSAVGAPQITERGDWEPALLTAGSAIHELKKLLEPGMSSYSVKDVIQYLLNPVLV